MQAALDAGADVEAVFVTGPGADSGVVTAARQRGVPVNEVAAGVIERVATTTTPQPVVATVRYKPASLGSLGGTDLVVVAVGVQDPGNAGTLLRSAEGAGCGAVIFCGGSVDATNPKLVRASAGALFSVPVVVAGDPKEVLGLVGTLGFRRFGTQARGGEPYDDVDLTGPVALVLGNEAHGLPAPLGDVLDGVLTIPMEGHADSLNVGVAGAVLLFEAGRQRRATRGDRQ